MLEALAFLAVFALVVGVAWVVAGIITQDGDGGGHF